MLVCVYLSVAFMELVTFPAYQVKKSSIIILFSAFDLNRYSDTLLPQLVMEVHGFFLYLYGLGAAFLIYVLIFAARGRRVVDNHKSHGSVTVRIGALVKSA